MSEYVIVTDSSCDLTQTLADELKINVIPLTFTLEQKEYANKLDWSEMSQSDFYTAMRNGSSCSTAAISVGVFSDVFEEILSQGKDVLYLGFSSGLSNTYNASTIAANDIKDKYPDRTILAVDTLCASLGQGMLVYNACLQKKAGKSISEVANWVEENRLKLCHWFTVDDLNFLKRGGRVSSTTAFVGTMLSIKPILHVDNEGHLINVGKTRGRVASLKALVEKMEERGEDLENQVIFISHGDCIEDAKKLEGFIKEKFKVKDIIINHVGSVIGSHSGPGTMALFFFGSER